MLRRVLIAVLALTALGACQLSLPGRDEAGPATAPGTPEEITVTPLDAPSAQQPASAAPPPAPGTDAAPADPAAAPDPPPPEPEAAAPVVPAAPKSAAQLSCERKGGRYSSAGPSGAMACVSTTRDGGKRCSRESDCDGLCLARSQTCAPIKPLFGCNEILQEDGRRVTLCID